MNYEKQTSPEENISPKTQELKDYIDDLSLEMVAYSADHFGSDTAAHLVLGTETGGRVIITRAQPGAERSDNFVKELSVSFHPGDDTEVDYTQLDYNFNEKGDGKLRKRIVAAEVKGMENVVGLEGLNSLADEGTRADMIAVSAMTTLANAHNVVANLKLGEEMGVNNQPVDEDEIESLIAQLKAAKVLDPANGYKPVN